MSRRIVLWPDTHHHYHHRKAVEGLLGYIAEVQPDEVCILGDFLDCKAPARWSRGTAAEFAADLLVEAQAGRETLGKLREVHEGPVTFLYGNHEDRLRKYVLSNAPALAGVVRDIDDLLDFEGFKVELKQQPYAIAPGVVAIHGSRLSQLAGQSAAKEVKRHGKSVVQGHSHRLGLVWETTDRDRFALEAGWLGDVRKAGYLDFQGVANWQLGFGELLISDSGKVYPQVRKLYPDGRVDGS